jgi:DNA-binding LacI/PurR family transcriptional regulator
MAGTDRRNISYSGNLTSALAESVRDEILSGKWPLQARLPTDGELARTHGVGMNTVRRALATLASEGLVERRRGSGTYVIGTPAQAAAPIVAGVLVPTTRHYFPEMLAGIESVLGAHGGQLMLRITENQPARQRGELRQVDELLAQSPAGLILAPTLVGEVDPEAYIRRLAAISIPLVLAERIPERYADSPLSYVSSDPRRGGYLAVRHLQEIGCRRIGLLSSRNTATSEGFYEGFSQAVSDYGLDSDGPVLRMPGYRDEHFAAYAERARAQRPDGIVCLGDVNAKRLLPHLRERGIAVPADISLITYEDEVARDAEVPLTAMVPPRYEVGRMAAQILLRRIELGPGAPVTHVTLEPQLVLRASTAATVTAATKTAATAPAVKAPAETMRAIAEPSMRKPERLGSTNDDAQG